jgi:hypothetical protein
MSDCPICNGTRMEAVDAALNSGRHPNLVRAQYRLDRSQLQWHIAHRAQEALTRQAAEARNPYPSQSLRVVEDHAAAGKGSRLFEVVNHLQAQALPQVTENPLSQFQQAWELAKDDDRMRASMLAWLNDQIRHDDMGL